MLVKEMWQSGADVIVSCMSVNLVVSPLLNQSIRFLLTTMTSMALGILPKHGKIFCAWVGEKLRILRRPHGWFEAHTLSLRYTLLPSCEISKLTVLQCPHEKACPLHHPGSARLVCGFSQRIQRPSFVRKTKHSGVGHEDIGYSYIVVRRGQRPEELLADTPRVGRLGQVGKREEQKEFDARMKPAHRVIHEADLLALGQPQPAPVEPEPSTSEVPQDSGKPDHLQSETPERVSPPSLIQTADEVENVLRQEAYTWPRLVFPPLKRSGHVIIDCCTAEGS